MNPSRPSTALVGRSLPLSGAALALLGLSVLAGWAFDVPVLMQFSPEVAPVGVDSAVALVLCGASVLAVSLRARRVAIVASGLVALLGVGFLVLVVFPAVVPGAALLRPGGVPISGWMPPDTAAGFTSAGVALMMIAARRRWWTGPATSLLGAVVLALGLATLVGYVVTAGTPWSWSQWTRMSVRVGAAFVLLGWAILHASRRERQPDEPHPLPVLALSATLVVTLLALLTWELFYDIDRQATSDLVLVSGLVLSQLLGMAVAVVQERHRSRLAVLNAELEAEARRRRIAEQQAQDAAAELRRANAELTNFARAAAHDLRDPLNAVSLQLGLLERGGASHLDARERALLSRAVAAAKRVDTLLTDMLDYARSDVERPRIAVDGGDALGRALQVLEARILESGARVERGALPVVLGDPEQLARVFQNLVGNAIKYSGATEPRIEVYGETRDGRAWLHVTDHGLGIPPDAMEHLFEPFRRFHPDRAEGTGMGLAICRRLVQRMGGSLSARSEPGRGSTFTIALDAAEPSIATDERDADAPDPAQASEPPDGAVLRDLPHPSTSGASDQPSTGPQRGS